jgi:DNA repair protein RadC
MLTSTPALTRESATSDLLEVLSGGPAPRPLPDLEDLASWSVLELKERWKLDDEDAAAVFAAFELGRRRQVEKLGSRPTFDSPAKVFAFAAPPARDLKYEVFRVFVLDSRNRLVAEEIVSRGILTASLVHPREVFRPALLAAGAAIIVAHNHPSGDPTPSRDDDGVTERLAKAGDLLGISLLDHIVIGETSYWSYRERGSISSRFDLAAARPNDRSLSTNESVLEGSGAMVKPDPYAFVLAPPGGIDAGHLVPVAGGLFGMLTRGAVVCRTFLPVSQEAAMRRSFRAAGFTGEPTPVPRALKLLQAMIRLYFEGGRVDPAEVPVLFDPGPINPLAYEVYRVLRRVRRGRTVTYGELAALAGRPGAARSVGGFMARNRFPLLIPCHRVLAHDGSLGGFSSSGGLADKTRLLRLEGVLGEAPAPA